MQKRDVDWNRVLRSLEFHLQNYRSNEKYLKDAGYEGIKTEIGVNIELEEAVWGLGQHGAFKRDEFRGFVETDARTAIEFVRKKIAEENE